MKRVGFIFVVIIFSSLCFADYHNVNGSKLYYRVLGKGEPLLLLHSGLNSSKVFNPVIKKLKKKYRLILIDSRGHGRSADNTQKPFSYVDFTEDVILLLNYLKIDKTFALGYSDGGVICYHLASKYPDRIKKIIACGANYKVSGMTAETRRWVSSNMKSDVIRKSMVSLYADYISFNPYPEMFRDYIHKTRDMWLRDPYINKDKLASIKLPVLILGGDKDAISLEHFLEIHRLIKNSQLCIIPDSYHNVIQSAPDLLVNIVFRFFADN